MIVINYPAAEVILREGGLSFSQVKKKNYPAEKYCSNVCIESGSWLGTFYIFPYNNNILGTIIPFDFHIFSEGNQQPGKLISHSNGDLPIKMVIFHSYVNLPEGNFCFYDDIC